LSFPETNTTTTLIYNVHCDYVFPQNDGNSFFAKGVFTFVIWFLVETALDAVLEVWKEMAVQGKTFTFKR
jgi:hypothetical protein